MLPWGVVFLLEYPAAANTNKKFIWKKLNKSLSTYVAVPLGAVGGEVCLGADGAGLEDGAAQGLELAHLAEGCNMLCWVRNVPIAPKV